MPLAPTVIGLPDRIGFSRESVGRRTAQLMVLTLASSRLKPVPQLESTPALRGCNIPSRTGFSREDASLYTLKSAV